MQNLIVLCVVLAACCYVGRKLFSSFCSGKSSQGCSGCGGGCSIACDKAEEEGR